MGEALYRQSGAGEVSQVSVNRLRHGVGAVLEGDAHASGRVRGAAGRGPSHIWASVRDDGPGIPEDRHAMIFDPFYTTKAPGRGTGLGLNIVVGLAGLLDLGSVAFYLVGAYSYAILHLHFGIGFWLALP